MWRKPFHSGSSPTCYSWNSAYGGAIVLEFVIPDNEAVIINNIKQTYPAAPAPIDRQTQRCNAQRAIQALYEQARLHYETHHQRPVSASAAATAAAYAGCIRPLAEAPTASLSVRIGKDITWQDAEDISTFVSTDCAEQRLKDSDQRTHYAVGSFRGQQSTVRDIRFDSLFILLLKPGFCA